MRLILLSFLQKSLAERGHALRLSIIYASPQLHSLPQFLISRTQTVIVVIRYILDHDGH